MLLLQKADFFRHSTGRPGRRLPADSGRHQRLRFRSRQELSVRSPLREAGLTKQEIREASRRAGLFTWNKPSYACLATRIPTGTVITQAQLCRTEWAEDYLHTLGFRDLRVRQQGNLARVQLPADQMGRFLSLREEILPTLKTRYEGVVLDLEERNGQ